jgi:hypothetical protein
MTHGNEQRQMIMNGNERQWMMTNGDYDNNNIAK